MTSTVTLQRCPDYELPNVEQAMRRALEPLGGMKALLGDAKRWKEIWAANKDLIKDPDLIQVGWKLRIPKES